MITQFKTAREASASMYKLDPLLPPPFRGNLRGISVLSKIGNSYGTTGRICAILFAYALMIQPEGEISGVSHFFPVTVNWLRVWRPAC
jgi:hypothetical protein